ncbi:MAG: DNA-processing protein DprA [Prevotella sp.]|nr:DNA-processing protein DprA [Bacteroides sp.]MCM1366342.1 DNA-processing protein DprA [Prevotella sp.]MCM1436300.1 DNA-processing protein DprA [Prevotella sp.]
MAVAAGNRFIMHIALGLIHNLPYAAYVALAKAQLSYDDFFALPDNELAVKLGVTIPMNIRRKALLKAESEAEFIEKHKIKALLCTDPDYPDRLRGKKSAPNILFVLGETNLNSPHIVNFVGSRNATPYGLNFTDRAVSAISDAIPDTIIVSGLAYGIDSAAHSAALRHSLPTIAIVAHGLDTIYPAAHRDLAHAIVKAGGAIITEYPSGTKPFRRCFLERNRIIAGISDLTIVVESDVKGGALSTAGHALKFGMKVAALPGRISDQYSSGCNALIASGKASLIHSPNLIPKILGAKNIEEVSQPQLTPEMSERQALIYEALRNSDSPLSPDQILPSLDIKIPVLISELNEMVFDGLLLRHPGNRFSTAM